MVGFDLDVLIQAMPQIVFLSNAKRRISRNRTILAVIEKGSEFRSQRPRIGGMKSDLEILRPDLIQAPDQMIIKLTETTEAIVDIMGFKKNTLHVVLFNSCKLTRTNQARTGQILHRYDDHGE